MIILKKKKNSEISAKKGLKTLNELKNIEIIKQEKCTPKQKELLNLFNDLSDAVLTDETLESKSQEEENESKNENDNKNENDKTLIPSKVEKEKENEKENEDKNEDENKNMLLGYMEDVDDKLFKKCSDGKDFNSFTNSFGGATNEKDKEKVVKELKDINSFVEHYAQMEDDYTEYKNKLFDIRDCFVYEYSKN